MFMLNEEILVRKAEEQIFEEINKIYTVNLSAESRQKILSEVHEYTLRKLMEAYYQKGRYDEYQDMKQYIPESVNEEIENKPADDSIQGEVITRQRKTYLLDF